MSRVSVIHFSYYVENLGVIDPCGCLRGGCSRRTKDQRETTNSAAAAEVAKPDQRGTKDSPLEVNEHSVQNDKEAAEEAAKDAEQKRVNGWNIELTGGIAVCALLQVIGIGAQIFVYLKQTGLLKDTLTEIHIQARQMTAQTELLARSISVAEKAAVAAEAGAIATQKTLEAGIAKDRARLRVSVIPLVFSVFESGNGKQVHISTGISVVHHGATEAIIDYSEAALIIRDSEQPDPDQFFTPAVQLPDVFSADKASAEITMRLYNQAVGLPGDVKDGRKFVHLYGAIAYKDLYLASRKTSFYFVWRVHKSTPAEAKWVRCQCEGYNEET